MKTANEIVDFMLENHRGLETGITREDLVVKNHEVPREWQGRGVVAAFSVWVPTDPLHVKDGPVDFERFFETSNGRIMHRSFIDWVLNKGESSYAESFRKSYGLT